MNIIGHRGAAGLALENTVESIRAAIKAGVDAIEFDIRVTEDGKLVLNHDRHLGRVSGQSPKINKHTLRKLKKVELYNGQTIATLSEALKTVGQKPVVIEGKESGWAVPLAAFLKNQPNLPEHKVISFNHHELYAFSQLIPEVPVFAAERTDPFSAIRTARFFKFTGIDLNFWILNPLTYTLARFYKLEVIVYTVNSPWMARFLRLLYPRISITTNLPNKLQFLRGRKHSVVKKVPGA